MNDGSVATTIAPKPAKEQDREFKVAEKREDGTVVIEMTDGRMFVATLKDGVEVRKHSKVALTNEAEDAEGVPLNAVVTRVL